MQFGGKKYFWGNIPALDVLQLGSNEGEAYIDQLYMLFAGLCSPWPVFISLSKLTRTCHAAASGDFRNVAKTIAQLPGSYNQTVNVIMNDRDLDIVARNAIMLLVGLVIDDEDDAVDCMIHIWYLALIRMSDLNILQKQIRPLIESVCEKAKNKAPNSLLGKTWSFKQRSLRLVLKKSAWDSLLCFTDIPEGLTAERANEIRTAVTLAESRKDYRERRLFFQPPPRRIAMQRFREDGLLLPFGFRRSEFREPNP